MLARSLLAKMFHPILNDPEVRSLERLLRVKAKVEDHGLLVRLPGRLLGKPPVSVDANKAGGRVPLLRVISVDGCVGSGNGIDSLLKVSTPLLLQRMRLQVRARESLDCLRYVSLNLPSL